MGVNELKTLKDIEVKEVLELLEKSPDTLDEIFTLKLSIKKLREIIDVCTLEVINDVLNKTKLEIAQLNKHGGRKHGNYKTRYADCDTKR